MKPIKTLMATVGLILMLAASSFAQTTLTSTTLAAAATATATQVNVTSASGIEVGDYLAVLRSPYQVAEIMTVRAINGTFLTVSRGTQFPAVAHRTASVVYHAPPAQFYTTDPVPGTTCTRANELYLPHINRVSRVVSDCATAGGVWYRLDVANDASRNLISVTGTATLDGSNPTPVTTGLNGIVTCALTQNRSSAPGDDPVAFTATWANGGTLNIYAWKHDGTDPTLTASTDSDDVVAWECRGT